MKGALLGLALEIGLKVDGRAEIHIGFAVMPQEKDALSDQAGIILVTEKNILEIGGILFRALLKEHKLGYEEYGVLHLLLRFQQELKVILLLVDKSPDKTLRIDEEDEGGDAFLNGFAVKAGLVRAGKAMVPVEIGKVRKSDPGKMGERQQQGKIEVKGNLGMGQTLEFEMIMIEEIVELAPILEGKNHRALLVHLLQVFLCAFIELRALEEPVEHPAKKESRFEVKHIGIVNFFSEGIQALSSCFSVDINSGIQLANQVFCGIR
jgi:hypothetical protein